MGMEMMLAYVTPEKTIDYVPDASCCVDFLKP